MTLPTDISNRPKPGDIFIKHWFGIYALYLLATGIPLTLLIIYNGVAIGPLEGLSWSEKAKQLIDAFAGTDTAVKTLVFAIYLSMCTTFTPLPTGWLVAGVATRQAALVPESLVGTVLLVATVGAVASTVANLNDYHLFTWMLRHHRIGKVRQTKAYLASAKWFERAPFFLLVVFNIIPIPVDVVRMIATTYRYPRLRFAIANFIGRFVRYGVIAFVTYWWNLGWIAVVALLGIAVLFALIRVTKTFWQKIFAKSANATTT